MKNKFSAWAIDTKSTEGHGLIGRYWHFKPDQQKIPEHLEGCKTALFKTRKIARENISSVKKSYSFPNAVIIKVDVIIKQSK